MYSERRHACMYFLDIIQQKTTTATKIILEYGDSIDFFLMQTIFIMSLRRKTKNSKNYCFLLNSTSIHWDDVVDAAFSRWCLTWWRWGRKSLYDDDDDDDDNIGNGCHR